MSWRAWLGILGTACLLGIAAAPAPATASGVRILVTRDGFACRDLSDAVRLGLRMLDGDKSAFLAFYMERQKSGACERLQNGTIADLMDSHDEQDVHLACIKQPWDDACVWALHPSFGPAPY